MTKFKIGFGPMSTEITDILCEYTEEKNYPLMIIASRNQVDSVTGYVKTTSQLAEQVRRYPDKNILLCRDHCGPYFADLDRGLDIETAITRCKETIGADISNGFDLIHIDVSRIKKDQLRWAQELIEFALKIEPNIKLEFGSEDNTGIDVNSSIARIDSQIEFLKPYQKNVVFFVSQTGSLTKDGQMGKFNIKRNKEVSEQLHAAGYLFKEHNADYFTPADIEKRIKAGVDAINIAPQLGKMQTDLLTELAGHTDEYKAFADYVYSKPNIWTRWMSNGSTDKDTAVSVSGHYHFGTVEYQRAHAMIDQQAFYAELKRRINKLVDMYRTFDKE
jgi:tagatose-1,6-bisphosphate aldolase non-catalytic subunit AgaZ/GatZ